MQKTRILSYTAVESQTHNIYSVESTFYTFYQHFFSVSPSPAV